MPPRRAAPRLWQRSSDTAAPCRSAWPACLRTTLESIRAATTTAAVRPGGTPVPRRGHPCRRRSALTWRRCRPDRATPRRPRSWPRLPRPQSRSAAPTSCRRSVRPRAQAMGEPARRHNARELKRRSTWCRGAGAKATAAAGAAVASRQLDAEGLTDPAAGAPHRAAL